MLQTLCNNLIVCHLGYVRFIYVGVTEAALMDQSMNAFVSLENTDILSSILLIGCMRMLIASQSLGNMCVVRKIQLYLLPSPHSSLSSFLSPSLSPFLFLSLSSFFVAQAILELMILLLYNPNAGIRGGQPKYNLFIYENGHYSRRSYDSQEPALIF
jgi:hypothetical protein